MFSIIKRAKLKSKFIFLFLIFSYLTSQSQTFQLKILGKTAAETHIIDSIGYSTINQNSIQISDKLNTIAKKLIEAGYINSYIIKKTKQKDSSSIVTISLEKKIKYIHIYIGKINNLISKDLFDSKKDSLTLPYTQAELFLKQTLQKLELNGYAFAKVKLDNIQQKDEHLHAELIISTGIRRNLNSIEIKYSNSQHKNIFPKGAEKQINKKYQKTIFNQNTVKQINQDFEEFGFINQIKFPEILFTKDTTKVFVYLEKRNTNNFEGYLGFNNTENKKIQLNGYLDLTLINILLRGEELSVYWKNDGNNQKTFNANLNLPYLFNSPIALKTQINIYKQDSIFQNTRTNIQLGYYLNYNRRIYFGYESTESSDIQNTNNQNLTDYKNIFYTTTLTLKKNQQQNILFPTKSSLNLILGSGNRTTQSNLKTKQYFINFNIMENIYINEKNSMNITGQTNYLKSKNYIINELYRFGGINSIRGFAENSLQANLLTALLTEYRHILTSNFYFNTILDYCYYEGPTLSANSSNNEKLLGIGLGFGALTSNGLLKFAITNGKSKKEEFKFYNTNITISYNVKF